MKVLLIAIDLYDVIGGGQAVYRKIIESAPNIEFMYFSIREPKSAARPANARPIPLAASLSLRVLAPPPFPAFRYHALRGADRYARSVAGMSFDIVDAPDFLALGGALRDAFTHHKVSVGRYVLAMHGNISTSIELGWELGRKGTLELRMLEQEQFATVDGSYAISPSYIAQWKKVIDREIYYIDPLNFINIKAPATSSVRKGDIKPDLYCIGRMERRKGNDLFIKLIRWLDRKLYSRAIHIGEYDYCVGNVCSTDLLKKIAADSDVPIEIAHSYSSDKLAQLFAEKSFIILPVRYDTLNLVALEAIFSGCPVAISSEAGVCDYLDRRFPELPYVKIDFNNFYGAVPALADALAHYDVYRTRLNECLKTTKPEPENKLDMQVLYMDILKTPPRQKDTNDVSVRYIERGLFGQSGIGMTLLARVLRKILPLMAAVLVFPYLFIASRLKQSRYFSDALYVKYLQDSLLSVYRLARVGAAMEGDQKALRNKLDSLYGRAVSPFCRCNFWLDIARIERLLDNDMLAVTYELRLLRLLGRDQFGLLPRVLKTLRDQGFVAEAQAAQILYGDSAHTDENVYRFLKDAYQRNLTKLQLPLEKIDDRRVGEAKVSVVVSLYNAAPKLKLFLTCLAQQTLVQRGLVEIILVDSGSPDREYEEILAFIESTPLNMVYIRSAERETIQAAWNRGIHIAHAPYLCFLGADETLYPEALETLANELDRDAAVDWVMADSLVTNVDERGVYKNDVMTYRRDGGTKDHVYLETCYLSWVGGMYRKSIHERFGYYDETFRAAGDTEFKNRILPYINVKFIPKTLGLFLNYPDDRTTASPRAEIEDLRAWYIHRMLGGVRYAFENRPRQDAEKLFYAAVGYRKSYCKHISADFDYATYLAEYLSSATTEDVWKSNAADMLSLMQMLRDLEYTDKPIGYFTVLNRMIGAWGKASTLQAKHTVIWNGWASPTYKVFNDNRYEQHSWLWKSS